MAAYNEAELKKLRADLSTLTITMDFVCENADASASRSRAILKWIALV